MKIPFDRHTRKFASVRDLKSKIQDAIARKASIDFNGHGIPPGDPATGEPTAPDVPKLTLPDVPEGSAASMARQPAPPVTLPRRFHARVAPPAPNPQKARKVSLYPVLFLALGCLALGTLGGYCLSRARQKLIFAAPGGQPQTLEALTPAEDDRLDAAYTTRRAEHFAEAEKLFAALAHDHPAWKAMEVEIGRTMFYENNSEAARKQLIAAAGDEGGAAAEADFLLGLVSVRQKAYRAAEWSFASATALNPTEPNYYYFWGECLRDEGKPAQAALKYHSAMLRNQYETNVGLYRLKYWLCKIETDEANAMGLNAEIDAALAQPRPPMEVFFAAAARDIGAGDFKAAASRLRQARAITPPAMFAVIMRDPLFKAERSQPELAEMFLSEAVLSGEKIGATAGSPTPATMESKPEPTPAPRASSSPAIVN